LRGRGEDSFRLLQGRLEGLPRPVRGPQLAKNLGILRAEEAPGAPKLPGGDFLRPRGPPDRSP